MPTSDVEKIIHNPVKQKRAVDALFVFSYIFDKIEP